MGVTKVIAFFRCPAADGRAGVRAGKPSEILGGKRRGPGLPPREGRGRLQNSFACRSVTFGAAATLCCLRGLQAEVTFVIPVW